MAEQDTSHPVAIVTDFRWERMILLFRFFTDKELIDVSNTNGVVSVLHMYISQLSSQHHINR